jgi:hypothetical protein
MRRHKVLGAFFLAAILGVACSEEDSPTETPPPPVVSGISATSVSPGDTVLITGSDFSATETENTVTFTNPLSAAAPLEASETELRVVVDKDATSGPVTVTTDGGSDQTANVDVSRGVGDVFVFGGTGANYQLSLPNPSVATQYLVVPHAANNAQFTIDFPYDLASESVPPVALRPTAEATRGLHIGAHEWFEAQRWENAGKVIEEYGVPRGTFDRKRTAAQPVGGTTQQFYVLRTSTGNQNLASSYARITALLRYSGSKCLVYSDIDTLPTGNFTPAHYFQFGQAFDGSIDATNVSYFGAYSDVDGNDRIIILVSPVVNNLQEPPCAGGDCMCGFIAGFFNPRDLYGASQVPSGTSNHAEIIYLLAADPNGTWDCQFPVSETAQENLGTIPHEHEHLISFSHRVFQQGGVTQAYWLEEGMAHMAEDLNGDNSSNIARGKLYRADPGNISLENNNTPLEQRGGIYLMLRLLADRYGTDILKDIVQSKCTGRACIQSVTGLGFYEVFAEFLAALYLSGRFITDDERYNYTSIHLDSFDPLTVALHPAPGADASGTVRRTAGDFHIFTGALNQTSVFTFTNPGGGAGLRNVIVRIQ